MVNERTAVLIVRAWTESDARSPLRASLRYTSAVGLGAWRATNLADPDAVVEFVRSWLDEVAAQGSSPEEPQTPAEDNWLNEGGASAG